MGLLGALWLLPHSVRADNPYKGEAERRYRTAKRLYNEGRYESALRMWQSAYDLNPDPRYLFNAALAKEKISDNEGCALDFREFLRKTENQKGQEAVREAAKSRMETCLRKTVIPVRFTSVPTNAAILFGEGEEKEPRGRTPRDLKLPLGKHHVTVALPGYVSQEQVIEVAIGERPNPDFVLEKLSSLHIEVDPSGARVKLDDGAWEPAPVTREVRAGTYAVQVEKDGYETERRQVPVTSGQEKSLMFSLRPLPTIRTLSVTLMRPRGGSAHVEVDGRRAGTAPIETTLSPGKHEIDVRAPGHIPYASSITVPEDRDLRLQVRLERERSTWNQVTFWGLCGAAGIAAVTGATYGILALSDQSAFNDDRNNVDLYNRGRQRADRADVWLGTAIVIGAGAFAYRYFTRPGSSSGILE